MISTSPFGTLGLIASLWAATLYQENQNKKYKHWNIVSTGGYILFMQALHECCQQKNGKFKIGNWNHLFCWKALLSTDSHISVIVQCVWDGLVSRNVYVDTI